MLNWIAIWVGIFLFGLGGPLQNDTQPCGARSRTTSPTARSCPSSGATRSSRASTSASSSRSRARRLLADPQPDDARLRGARGRLQPGGGALRRHQRRAQLLPGDGDLRRASPGSPARSTSSAGSSGSARPTSRPRTIGFIGIAVALLGRNTAVGVGLAALLFGALADRHVDAQPRPGDLPARARAQPHAPDPGARRALRRRRRAHPLPLAPAAEGRRGGRQARREPRVSALRSTRLPRGAARDRLGRRRSLGILAACARRAAADRCCARPSVPTRRRAGRGRARASGAFDPRRAARRRRYAIAVGRRWASALGVPRDALERGQPRGRRRLVGALSPRCSATRRRSSSPRSAACSPSASGVVNIGLEGMMLMGAFFGILGADKTGLVARSASSSALLAGGCSALIHAFFSIHLRADQIVGGTAINFLALGITGYLFIDIYGEQGTPSDGLPTIPDVSLDFLDDIRRTGSGLPRRCVRAAQPPDLGRLRDGPHRRGSSSSRHRSGCGSARVGEHPRAADTVGHLRLPDPLRGRDPLRRPRRARRRVPRRSASSTRFNENMTAGRGFIALAALIFGNWRPFGAAVACLLFGFSSALAQRLPEYSLVRRDALPGAPVRPHADRRRRRHRPLDPARRHRQAVRQAVAWARTATVRRGARSSLASRPSRRSRSRST